MRAVERALRAELRALGVDLAASSLARAALDLARRLDAGPGDRDAVDISRELRQITAELHRRAAGGMSSELEAFLGRIATPAFRGPGD